MTGTGGKLTGLALAERLWIAGGLVVVSTLAWIYTIHMARGMGAFNHPDTMTVQALHHMAGHGGMHSAAPHPAEWGVPDIWIAFVMWAVMMAAMMLPTAIPMVLAFAAMNRRREDGGAVVPAGTFTAGYLAAWALYCVGATALQWGLHRAALLSPATLATGPLLGGVLLVAAGVFQWTPWKDACLEKCRNPLGFLLTHWRAGHLGAFRLGSRYGVYCVGCCWLLMLICFSLGVMNLVWMALLTILMMVEKIAPGGLLISRTAGVALALWGGWMVLS